MRRRTRKGGRGLVLVGDGGGGEYMDGRKQGVRESDLRRSC
jgi:hypothetical protein